MATASPLIDISRTDAAFNAYARAIDRLRRLEMEAKSAFEEHEVARNLLAAERVVADVELEDGIAAALSEWRRKRAATEGATEERARWPMREDA